MIHIYIHCEGADDLYVSVFDLNTADNHKVLDQVRINADADVKITVTDDGDGNGKVSWIATRTDDAGITKSGVAEASEDDIVDVNTFGV